MQNPSIRGVFVWQICYTIFMDHLEWQAYEYTPKKNSSDWYWTVGIVAVTVAIISIFFSNIIFAIFVIIAAASLALFTLRHPSTHSYEINEKGIRVENRFYPYDTLDAFWIEDYGHVPKVLIKSQKTFMPLIVMPIGDVHPADIRDFLLGYLPEKQLSEPLPQKLMEYLGF